MISKPSAPRLKWYGLKVWKDLRAIRLAAEPLCRCCKQQGRLTPGNTVDHITPHRGDWALFTGYSNTQTLCRVCHSVGKQRDEHRGFTSGCDVHGIPYDSHWNKE